MTFPFHTNATAKMNFLFILLLCILSVTFATEERTIELNKHSPETTKDNEKMKTGTRAAKAKSSATAKQNASSLRKQEGVPLYRRGLSCSTLQNEAETEVSVEAVKAALRIAQDRLGPIEIITRNINDFAVLRGEKTGRKKGRAERRGKDEPSRKLRVEGEEPNETHINNRLNVAEHYHNDDLENRHSAEHVETFLDVFGTVTPGIKKGVLKNDGNETPRPYTTDPIVKAPGEY
jgi:hypothetical protein